MTERGEMKGWVTTLGIMLLPLLAQGAEVIQLADNNAAPKRFMSLDSVRNGSAQLRTTSGTPMRSDRALLNGGFMRIDRPRAIAIKPQAALLVAPTATKPNAAPLIIHGDEHEKQETPTQTVANDVSNDPVLSLFNGAGNTPLASFHDTLRGAATSKHSWPLPASQDNVSSGYGMRADPLNGKAEFHGGIDIAAPTGTPVLASADGTVSEVTEDAMYGKSIAILHPDGSETHYGHLSAQKVRPGQKVLRGQIIGAVGATGRVTGAHLDYRVSQNGLKLDPLHVLKPLTVASTTRPATNSKIITVR